MKKYIITIVSTMILFGTSTAYASDMDVVDKNLLERGYPVNVLEHMCDENKLELYKNKDLHYGGATMIQYCEETGESKVIDMDNSYDTYGQIPEEDLTIMLTPSGKTANGKLEYIDFLFDYKWKKTPVNRYQDPITISFDYNGADYRLKYDIFRKVDKYKYLDANMNLKTATKSDEKSAALKAKHGVGWYADLAGGAVQSLYGYGEFRVDGTTPTENGIIDASFLYAHAKSSVSVSVPIPRFPGGSIAVDSESGKNDEMGDALLIKWKNGKIVS